MAKKQKVKREFESTVGSLGAECLGLKPPYAACPVRNPTHGLYLTKGENSTYVGFCAAYAARKFLDVLFADDGLTKVKSAIGELDTVMTDTGIAVRIHDKSLLDELLNYKYSGKEEEWELDEQSTNRALRFRDLGFERPNYKLADTADGEPKAKREPRAEKPKRPSKEGLTTIQAIAAELKMEPREARGILRKMKTPKPDVGWAWPEKEAAAIKKLIKDNQD